MAGGVDGRRATGGGDGMRRRGGAGAGEGAARARAGGTRVLAPRAQAGGTRGPAPPRGRLATVYEPAARVAVVVRVVRLREEVWRGRRGARRRVDLVEEPAEAARAEDVGGRVGDDADGAAALVAPVHAARPVVPHAALRRHRRRHGVDRSITQLSYNHLDRSNSVRENLAWGMHLAWARRRF